MKKVFFPCISSRKRRKVSYNVISEVFLRFSSKSWPTAKDGLTKTPNFCKMKLCMDGKVLTSEGVLEELYMKIVVWSYRGRLWMCWPLSAVCNPCSTHMGIKCWCLPCRLKKQILSDTEMISRASLNHPLIKQCFTSRARKNLCWN